MRMSMTAAGAGWTSCSLLVRIEGRRKFIPRHHQWVSSPRLELAKARLDLPPPGLHHDLTAHQGGDRPTCQAHALIRRMVHGMVKVCVSYDSIQPRVPDANIGVHAAGNRSFARMQAE